MRWQEGAAALQWLLDHTQNNLPYSDPHVADDDAMEGNISVVHQAIGLLAEQGAHSFYGLV